MAAISNGRQVSWLVQPYFSKVAAIRNPNNPPEFKAAILKKQILNLQKFPLTA